MSAALDSSLYAAAAATFEQVVFMLPDTPPDDRQRARSVSAIANIAFSGPAAGVLQVRACEGLLPLLTANMMGGMEASEALQLDALGEIANIICGQIFPHLAVHSAFEQKPPEVSLYSGPGTQPTNLPAASVEIGLEDSRADVLLYLYAATG
jgi:CheY-specific phosphatase CheX